MSDLWPEAPARLYCVLDAATDARIYPALQDLAAGERIESLYDGEAAALAAGAGPYLIELDPDGAALDWLLAQPGADGWGILLTAEAGFDAVRAHLRRLVRVRTEDGRVVLFRFYDPAVLGTLLPTFDEAQVAEVFGPVDAFRLLGRDGGWTEHARPAGTAGVR